MKKLTLSASILLLALAVLPHCESHFFDNFNAHSKNHNAARGRLQTTKYGESKRNNHNGTSLVDSVKKYLTTLLQKHLDQKVNLYGINFLKIDKLPKGVNDTHKIINQTVNTYGINVLSSLTPSRKHESIQNNKPLLLILLDPKTQNTRLEHSGPNQFTSSDDYVRQSLRSKDEPKHYGKKKVVGPTSTALKLFNDMFHFGPFNTKVIEQTGILNVVKISKNGRGPIKGRKRNNVPPRLQLRRHDSEKDDNALLFIILRAPTSRAKHLRNNQIRPSLEFSEDSYPSKHCLRRGKSCKLKNKDEDIDNKDNKEPTKYDSNIVAGTKTSLNLLNNLFHLGPFNTGVIESKGLVNIVQIENRRRSSSSGRSHSSKGKVSDRNFLDRIGRRNILRSGDVVLGSATRPEHLPEALPIHPGHTLLRPSRGMLKSSVKYPLRDFGGSAVYGNLDNLGITWGKTRNRIRYSDFRKANNHFLNKFQNSIQSIKNDGEKRAHPLILVEIDPSEIEAIKQRYGDEGSTILDNLSSMIAEDSIDPADFRRRSKHKSRHRHRSKSSKRSKYSDDDDSKDETSSEEESLEKNEGNPFTIHKNKYYQNYLWNHKLDGLHMNINPYAPQLNRLGPSGADFFYARKWWYFNQDDFKPMGRKR